jgi:hypothetical protein
MGYKPRSFPCFDDSSIGKNHGEIDNPIFHGPVPYSIRATILRSALQRVMRASYAPATGSDHAADFCLYGDQYGKEPCR